MNLQMPLKPTCRQFCLYALPVFFLLFSSLLSVSAQGLSAKDEGEPVHFKMKIKNKDPKLKDKDYELKANAFGHFPQVSNVPPLSAIPIEVMYPQGTPGEKVVLSAEDGGSFDNQKQVMVVSLNAQKTAVFTFQVTDQPGVFEIILHKGNDIKTIHLTVSDN